MRRVLVAVSALVLTSACGSSSTPAAAPASSNPDMVAMYLAAAGEAQGCGDPNASLGYVPQPQAGYLLVAQGHFVCNNVSTLAGASAPTGTVITVEGWIDRYGRFAGNEFSLTRTAPAGVIPLHAPPADWKPTFHPDLIREIVTKQAARCGDAHPTNIRYVTTTRQAAEDRAIDYTISAGRARVYAVVAEGRFTCRHWARKQPVPAVRTRMTMLISADGSGLNVDYEVIDTIAHVAQTAGPLSLLP